MRIKTKYIPLEYYTIKKFLWFPKKIGNQIRWLEKAKFRGQYIGWTIGGSWINMEWID